MAACPTHLQVCFLIANNIILISIVKKYEVFLVLVFTISNSSLHHHQTLGSVVDQEVTRKEWYDFFLVSQSVRQGTVSPTHYNVIHDTTGLKPDHMQRLTYKLTHLYYNWPVGVMF